RYSTWSSNCIIDWLSAESILAPAPAEALFLAASIVIPRIPPATKAIRVEMGHKLKIRYC
ncbi:hypothetical protein, partial [Mesorhizobium sp. M8A.F.Ca.ET.181.01.1.1]|uniref:hypothetical protein n=1 Tax=Mesorhizobium sp. M8A.F.Ca.ET.181.01.1.1 TaxID=2563963 RepID=UPI001AED3C18